MSINGIGKKFPITLMGKATNQSTPSSAEAIRPPLSSNIGSSDTKKVASSGVSHDPKKLARLSASPSKTITLSFLSEQVAEKLGKDIAFLTKTALGACQRQIYKEISEYTKAYQ